MAALAPALAGLPRLDTLNLWAQGLEDETTCVLARALAGRTSLTSLLGISVGDAAAATVARCLQHTTNLARLTGYFGASAAGLPHLTQCIGSLPHLRELAIELSPRELDKLALFETALLGLTQLQVGCESFDTAHGEVLGPVISRCSQLRYLCIAVCEATTVADELWLCRHLTAISGNLTRLHLESENEASFIACVPTMTALQHLSLRALAPRRDGTRDWRSLCAPLAALPGLTALRLQMLRPGDGADAAAGLSLLTALRCLEFFNNEWHPGDISTVAPALSHMAALTELAFFEPAWVRRYRLDHGPSLSAVAAAVAVLAAHVSALSQLRALDVCLWRPRHKELRNTAAGQALVRSLRRCPGARVRFGYDE